MFWVGLFLTVADVLVALALANWGAKSAAKTAALEQSGVLALAHITGMGETGTRINDQPLIKLDLHIEGPGITPFDTRPRHRLGDPDGQLQRTQTRRTRRPGHQPVPDRLGAKRFGQRTGTCAIHCRGRRKDLRPVRAGRPADGDSATAEGQWHSVEPHGRHPVEPRPAPTDSGDRAARRRPAGPARACSSRVTAPSPSPSFTPPEPSISQRLQELETLRATGAVTEEEYKAKRSQIISEI